MQTQEVAIKPTMKVFMKVDSEMLDEVIVVAYGTAKKSAFTGSASVVKADKLEKRQVSNITNALSGSVAGVQTTSSNGQPGTSATVRIRGIGSILKQNIRQTDLVGRFGGDEFVILFKNTDLDSCYNRIDSIRKMIK